MSYSLMGSQSHCDYTAISARSSRDQFAQVEFPMGAQKGLQVPCATNGKKLATGVKLIMLDDLNLIKVTKQLKDKKASK